MRIKKCAALHCNNVNPVSVFTFPKILESNGLINHIKAERCKMWIANCGNKMLNEKELSSLHQRYFLCANHFEDDQFYNYHRKTLLRTAVPTKFVHLISDSLTTGSIVIAESSCSEQSDFQAADGLRTESNTSLRSPQSDLQDAIKDKFLDVFTNEKGVSEDIPICYDGIPVTAIPYACVNKRKSESMPTNATKKLRSSMTAEMDPDMAQERKPVPKSVRRRNNMETAFEKARREVLSLQLNVRKAAERYGVPMAELENSTKMDIPVTKLTSTQKNRRRLAKVRNSHFEKLLLQIKNMEEKQKLAEGSGEELAPSGREEKQELAPDKVAKKPEVVEKKKKKQKETAEGRLRRLISQRERRRQQRLQMWKNGRDRAEALLKAKMAGKSSQESLEEDKVLLADLERHFVAAQKVSRADQLLPRKRQKMNNVRNLERQPHLKVGDDRRARLSRLRATDPSEIMKGVW